MIYQVNERYINDLKQALRNYDRSDKDTVFDRLLEIRDEADRLIDNIVEMEEED